MEMGIPVGIRKIPLKTRKLVTKSSVMLRPTTKYHCDQEFSQIKFETGKQNSLFLFVYQVGCWKLLDLYKSVVKFILFPSKSSGLF